MHLCACVCLCRACACYPCAAIVTAKPESEPVAFEPSSAPQRSRRRRGRSPVSTRRARVTTARLLALAATTLSERYGIHLHQLGHGGDVVDQPDRLAGAPLPAVRVAVLLGLPAGGGRQRGDETYAFAWTAIA